MLFSRTAAQLTLILGLVVATCAQPPSKTDPPSTVMRSAAAPKADDGELTQTFTSDNNKITLYPLQVESWKGDSLKGRAVVSFQKPAAPQPVYGLVWLTAKTDIDSKTRRVRFEQVRVNKAQFPSEPWVSPVALKALRDRESDLLAPISLDNLQSNVAVGRAESEMKHVPLRNGPPKIVVKRSPTLLVLVDGAPVLRDAGAPNLMRVINTRALILFDSSKGRYFLYMGDRWMDALSLQGPWIETDQPSKNLEEAKKIAVNQNQVDLLNEPESKLMKELAQHVIPEVFVSTEPAEVIETVGKPELQSIPGTKLLFVSNTENHVFLNQRDQNYYVLLSGRWYRGKTLDGPWKYVAADKLPKDFAKIPETHRKGSVLASVAGTQEAGEAKISNDAPQTARVDRHQASLDVKYDGSPQFKPIEETKLKYAVNSKTPVIEVDPHSYYALQAGVWFTAQAPEGPWAVATRVPAEIYTIPPSSPIYYVTYVRIYDSTPDTVYVGYTPGYLGNYCCSDGVVVYGTGYYYPPWIGTYWIGPPVTFGIGFYAGPAFYPWWGPWWPTPVYVGYPYAAIGAAPVGAGTVYQGWSNGVVQYQNPAPFQSAYLGKGGEWSMGGQSAGQATHPNPPPEAFTPQPAAPPPAAAPPPMAAPPVWAPPAAPPAAMPGNAGALSHGFSGGGGGWSAHK